MSYTYLSTTDIAPRFSDTPLVDGTEWNEAMAEFFTIHAECGIEVVSTGWSGALGKFVSIQTAFDHKWITGISRGFNGCYIAHCTCTNTYAIITTINKEHVGVAVRLYSEVSIY